MWDKLETSQKPPLPEWMFSSHSIIITHYAWLAFVSTANIEGCNQRWSLKDITEGSCFWGRQRRINWLLGMSGFSKLCLAMLWLLASFRALPVYCNSCGHTIFFFWLERGKLFKREGLGWMDPGLGLTQLAGWKEENIESRKEHLDQGHPTQSKPESF